MHPGLKTNVPEEKCSFRKVLEFCVGGMGGGVMLEGMCVWDRGVKGKNGTVVIALSIKNFLKIN